MQGLYLCFRRYTFHPIITYAHKNDGVGFKLRHRWGDGKRKFPYFRCRIGISAVFSRSPTTLDIRICVCRKYVYRSSCVCPEKCPSFQHFHVYWSDDDTNNMDRFVLSREWIYRFAYIELHLNSIGMGKHECFLNLNLLELQMQNSFQSWTPL